MTGHIGDVIDGGCKVTGLLGVGGMDLPDPGTASDYKDRLQAGRRWHFLCHAHGDRLRTSPEESNYRSLQGVRGRPKASGTRPVYYR